MAKPDKAQLERKLGKLQFERMQVEAKITPLDKRFKELTLQIVKVANEIVAIKPKKGAADG